MSDEMFVTSTAGTSPVVFHTDPDCPRLSKVKNVRERSEQFVEFHDLSLCKYCDDSVDTAYNKG